MAAMFSFAFGGLLRCWKIGWNGRFPESYPKERLWWKVINWGRRSGLSVLDFVWLPDDAARALRESGVVTPDLDGIGFFKLGFGGTLASSSGPRACTVLRWGHS